MMPVLTVIERLNSKQKAVLDYAHEHDIAQFIEYEPGRFVGVDAERISYLHIEKTDGRWSIGTIHRSDGVAVLHQSS